MQRCDWLGPPGRLLIGCCQMSRAGYSFCEEKSLHKFEALITLWCVTHSSRMSLVCAEQGLKSMLGGSNSCGQLVSASMQVKTD